MRQETTDVVVVGGGGAGLAAASQAARLGRSVVLLEKDDRLGGSTAWSVGSMSITNSPQQRRAGIKDTPDEHFDDLEALAGKYASRDNRALRRLLVDNITDTFAWLESLGLVFVGPNPEPPHRYPRMHNILPSSRAFPVALGRHCRRVGVDIRLRTAARRLVTEDGRVAGVEAEGPDGPLTLRARGGVVLAGGDYSASPALLSELASADAARLSPVNPGATGEGFALGRAVGARVVNGDIVRGPVMRFVPPRRRPLVQRLPPSPLLAKLMRAVYTHAPRRLVRPFLMSFLTTALGLSPDLLKAGAVLVNHHGERFTDELDGAAHATARQPEGEAFVVFDAAIAERFSAWPNFVSTAPGVAYAYLDDYRRTRPDIFHRAEDLAGLARSMGVSPGSLEAAIAAHNADHNADGGGRRGRPALTRAPFTALGPVKAYVAFTDGGLAVDTELRVLGDDDAPIPGLYAAGSNGQGGVLLEGHGHHLGWAFVSGRIAGRNAAFAVPPERANRPPETA